MSYSRRFNAKMVRTKQMNSNSSIQTSLHDFFSSNKSGITKPVKKLKVKKKVTIDEVIVIDSENENEIPESTNLTTSSPTKTHNVMELKLPVMMQQQNDGGNSRIIQKQKSNSSFSSSMSVNLSNSFDEYIESETCDMPRCSVIEKENCDDNAQQEKRTVNVRRSLSLKKRTTKDVDIECDSATLTDLLTRIKNEPINDELDLSSYGIKMSQTFDESRVKFEDFHCSQRTITKEALSVLDFEGIVGERDELNPLRHIMRTVAKSPHLYSLLHIEEKDLLYQFFHMPETYQVTCLRLYTRKPIWYNVANFLNTINVHISEQEGIDMLHYLQDKKILSTDYSKENVIDLLSLLKVEQLRVVCADFKVAKQRMKKQALIDALISHCNTQTTLGDSSHVQLMKSVSQQMGSCVKMEHSFHTILFHLNLLYGFTRRDLHKASDLFFFVRRLLEMEICLPHTSKSERVFLNIDDFNRFSFATEWFYEYKAAMEGKQKEIMLKLATNVFAEMKLIETLNVEANDCNFLRRFTAGEVYAKIMTMACEHFAASPTTTTLEWITYLIKQQTFGKQRRGDWYLRAAILYKKAGDIDMAGQMLYEGLCCPNVPIHQLHELSDQARALCNRRKEKPTPHVCASLNNVLLPVWNESIVPLVRIPAKGHDFQNSPGHKKHYICPITNEVTTVEQIAINYYSHNEYTDGVHCEGRLISTILMLLFWDIIYEMPDIPPAAFISEIQLHPLDMYSPYFYANRRGRIDQRLKQIETDWTDDELIRILSNSIEDNRKYTLILSQFDNLHLFDAVQCIGRVVLMKILRKIIVDLNMNVAGMPDLFIWNAHTKHYKFVEVKGERDQLSVKQKLWIEYLIEFGAMVEVCYVNTLKRSTSSGA